MAGSRNTKKAQVIKHLLTGNTVLLAAEKAGVTERTVYRWLSQPDFVEEIHRQERQVLRACSWRLVSMTKKALDAIEDVMDQPSQPGATNKRLASVAVHELALKYMDILTFEERLLALEKAVFYDKQ